MNRVCVQSAKARTGIAQERERQRSKSHFSANFDVDLSHCFLHLRDCFLSRSYVGDKMENFSFGWQALYQRIEAPVAERVSLDCLANGR